MVRFGAIARRRIPGKIQNLYAPPSGTGSTARRYCRDISPCVVADILKALRFWDGQDVLLYDG